MSTLDIQVGQHLRILAQVVTEICQRNTLAEVSEGQLSTNQFKILAILTGDNDLALSEIAGVLQISVAAASKNVDRLAALDLVERRPVPTDRRRHQLVLTENAHRLIEHYEDVSATKLVAILDRFDDQEKQTLLDLLGQVIRHTLADGKDAEVICLQCAGRCGKECVLRTCDGACRAVSVDFPGKHHPEVGGHAKSS